MSKSKTRGLLLGLGVAALAGVALALFLGSGDPAPGPQTAAPRPGRPAEEPSPPPPPPPDPRDTDATKLVNEFLGHVWARRYEQAYAQMASSYRKSTTLEQFRKACAGSEPLSGGAAVFVRETRKEPAADAPGGEGVLASASVVSGQGTVPVDVLLVRDGDALAVASVTVAGAPALAPRRR